MSCGRRDRAASRVSPSVASPVAPRVCPQSCQAHSQYQVKPQLRRQCGLIVFHSAHRCFTSPPTCEVNAMHDNFSGASRRVERGAEMEGGVGKPPKQIHTLHVNFMQFVMFYVPGLLMGANVTLGNLKMTDFNLYNLFY